VTLPCAYAVPFRFDRDGRSRRYSLVNTGEETLDAVTLTLHGAGMMSASAPTLLRPGHGVELTIRATDLARSTILAVRWLRSNGVEYLWTVEL
jgi:hypothetical protein